MRSQVATKEDAANACWKVINSPETPKIVHGMVLSQIQLPENPDLTSTQAVVEQIIELAWKRGFMDAMIAVESQALIKIPIENN